MKTSLRLIIFALTLTGCAISAIAQNKQSDDKERAERRKQMGEFMARDELRKATVRSLLDTCAEYRAVLTASIEAEKGSEIARIASAEEEIVKAKLMSKLAATSFNTIMPGMVPVEGIDDLETAKWRAIWNLYEAYEYGQVRAYEKAGKR